MSEITRGDFIKFFTIGTVSAFGMRYIDFLRSLEEEQPGPYSKIKPKMRIGFHTLNKGEVKPNQVMIAGETESRAISVYFGDKQIPPYPAETYDLKSGEYFTNSTSASDQKMKDYLDEIRQAGNLKIPYVVCDGRHAESIGLNRLVDAERMSIQRTIPALLLTIPATTIPMLLNIKRSARILNEYYRKKRENQDLPKPNLSLLPDSLVRFIDEHPEIIETKKICEAVGLGWLLGNLSKESALNVFNSILRPLQEDSLKIDEKYLAEIINLTNLRNISMALNMHLSQRMLDKMDPDMSLVTQEEAKENPEIFFFFGTGHSATQGAYEKGLEHISRQVEEEAERVINFWGKEIQKAMDKGDADMENILDFWIVGTSGFNFPLLSTMRDKRYLDKEIGTLPLSSRAIFWKVLLGKWFKNQKNPALNKMIGSILKEETAYFKHLEQILPGFEERLKRSKTQDWDYFEYDHQLYNYRIVEGIPYIENIDKPKS